MHRKGWVMHRRGIVSALVVTVAAAGLFAASGAARPTMDPSAGTDQASNGDASAVMATRYVPRPSGSATSAGGFQTLSDGGCVTFDSASNPNFYSPAWACDWSHPGWQNYGGEYWYPWYWANYAASPPYSFIGYQVYWYYWDGVNVLYAGCYDYYANGTERGLFCGRY